MAYVLVFAPARASLEEMVEAFGTRWTVEQCFGEAKGEVGMDEYEVRSWHGWYRHVTLSMLAMAFLTALRANEGEGAPEKSEQTPRMLEPGVNDSPQTQASSDLPEMVPLSVAEIRRLFFRLVGKSSLSFAYHLAWSRLSTRSSSSCTIVLLQTSKRSRYSSTTVGLDPLPCILNSQCIQHKSDDDQKFVIR
jgi:hypothetical protein